MSACSEKSVGGVPLAERPHARLQVSVLARRILGFLGAGGRHGTPPLLEAPDQNGVVRTLADLSGEQGLLLFLNRSADW